MRLSAPGKLFLTGEYAVLWGAPSTLAAVGPRLSAMLKPALPGVVSLRIPGANITGTWDGESIRWSREVPSTRFTSRALELSASGRALHLELGRGARGKRGQKLGLGSSAAAVTLATAAGQLAAGARGLDPARLFPFAARAHWEVQGQKGSNGDVAACCWGGVIRYQRFPVELPRDEQPVPAVERLDPNGLRLALVFSGNSAKTPSMVTAVERALSSEERQAFVTRSTHLTDTFARTLQSGEHAEALATLNAAGDLLDELGQRAGVSVVTPALARIQAIGRGAGLGAKVSGAGGGDGALFAAFDAAALDHALTEARAAGFESMPLALSHGVAVDAD